MCHLRSYVFVLLVLFSLCTPLLLCWFSFLYLCIVVLYFVISFFRFHNYLSFCSFRYLFRYVFHSGLLSLFISHLRRRLR